MIKENIKHNVIEILDNVKYYRKKPFKPYWVAVGVFLGLLDILMYYLEKIPRKPVGIKLENTGRLLA